MSQQTQTCKDEGNKVIVSSLLTSDEMEKLDELKNSGKIHLVALENSDGSFVGYHHPESKVNSGFRPQRTDSGLSSIPAVVGG